MNSQEQDITIPLEGAPIFKYPPPTLFTVRVGFKKIHPDAVLPKYAHVGDAGMDVYAISDQWLELNTPTLVKTGLVADIPANCEIQVRPRSGLALKGVTVFNAPGTIDANYRGEIGVMLFGVKGNCSFNSGSKIHKGDRIAQLVLAPVTTCAPVEVAEISDTDRGTGGFGSTGT